MSVVSNSISITSCEMDFVLMVYGERGYTYLNLVKCVGSGLRKILNALPVPLMGKW